MKTFKNEIEQAIAKWLEDATPEKEIAQEIEKYFAPTPAEKLQAIKSAWQLYNDPTTDEKAKEALYIALDRMIMQEG